MSWRPQSCFCYRGEAEVAVAVAGVILPHTGWWGICVSHTVPVIAPVWSSVTKRGDEDEQEQNLKSHSVRGLYWHCQNRKLEARSCQVEWGVERKTSHSLPRCQALCKPPLHRCQLQGGVCPSPTCDFAKPPSALQRSKGCSSVPRAANPPAQSWCPLLDLSWGAGSKTQLHSEVRSYVLHRYKSQQSRTS